MKTNDRITAEYILDLETLLDIVTAERDEYREEIKVLKGELALLRQDRRYEVGAMVS